MAWRVELDEEVGRDLARLDPQVARRILKFLFERIATLDDPRSIGEALKGQNWANFGNIEWAITALSAASRTVLCGFWW